MIPLPLCGRTIFYHIAATRPESHEDSAAWFLRFWAMWSVTESSDVLTRFAAR